MLTGASKTESGAAEQEKSLGATEAWRSGKRDLNRIEGKANTKRSDDFQTQPRDVPALHSLPVRCRPSVCVGLLTRLRRQIADGFSPYCRWVTLLPSRIWSDNPGVTRVLATGLLVLIGIVSMLSAANAMATEYFPTAPPPRPPLFPCLISPPPCLAVPDIASGPRHIRWPPEFRAR